MGKESLVIGKELLVIEEKGENTHDKLKSKSYLMLD
jgi:hypothetical protein